MQKRTWNPYLAGALTGILLVLSVLMSGHFLGASTTFARSASVIEKAVGIDPFQFEYFTTKKGKYGPGSFPNWQLLFVVGIVIGAFLSARLSGDFRIQTVPEMWRERFGPNPAKRGIVAFIGGAIGLVVARMAGGVTQWPRAERSGSAFGQRVYRPGLFLYRRHYNCQPDLRQTKEITMSLVYGLIIGIIFGFLLRKAQVLKYGKQKWLLISNPI